ncbi:MAG TPA: Hsp20/alpha crystallin family protein [Candidatus Wildermuthbacteria bacterium]|nr:Hsp20/alpha crystallin family protein [Candidatus Wildermuthbacteria bacterium]
MSIFDKLKGGMGLEDFEEEEVKEVKKKKSKKKEKKTSRKIEVKEEPLKPSKKEEKEENNILKAEGELTVDVYQTDKDIVIQTAVAGIKPEDIDISIEDDVITIRGERREITEESEKDYFFQECFWGSFSRQIILPEEVDVSKMEASFQNNVLTVRMPKLARKTTRKIKVKS